jgi:hypothetical protein
MLIGLIDVEAIIFVHIDRLHIETGMNKTKYRGCKT